MSNLLAQPLNTLNTQSNIDEIDSSIDLRVPLERQNRAKKMTLACCCVFLGILALLSFLQKTIFILLLALFAVAPGLILLYIFFGYRLRSPEYLRLVIARPDTIFFSALSAMVGVIPVFFIELGIMYLITQMAIKSVVLHGFLEAFFVAALVEEGLKFLVTYVFTYHYDSTWHPIAPLIYGLAAGMGFAIVENVMYVFSALATTSVAGAILTAIVRATVSVPLHCLCGLTHGYGLATQKFAPLSVEVISKMTGVDYQSSHSTGIQLEAEGAMNLNPTLREDLNSFGFFTFKNSRFYAHFWGVLALPIFYHGLFDFLLMGLAQYLGFFAFILLYVILYGGFFYLIHWMIPNLWDMATTLNLISKSFVPHQGDDFISRIVSKFVCCCCDAQIRSSRLPDMTSYQEDQSDNINVA